MSSFQPRATSTNAGYLELSQLNLLDALRKATLGSKWRVSHRNLARIRTTLHVI